MTTEQLEQLMQAHKCGFCISTCEAGYQCELYADEQHDDDVVGHGVGTCIIEAVYEALKSKLGSSRALPALLGFTEPEDAELTRELKQHSKDKDADIMAKTATMFEDEPPYIQ